jgi:hypothetical protein
MLSFYIEASKIHHIFHNDRIGHRMTAWATCRPYAPYIRMVCICQKFLEAICIGGSDLDSYGDQFFLVVLYVRIVRDGSCF